MSVENHQCTFSLEISHELCYTYVRWDAHQHLVLNDQEHRLIIESLNQLRNKLIADGKYTDAVDEVLLKIISAKQKKFKVFFKGA